MIRPVALAFAFVIAGLSAQGTADDYRRADRLVRAWSRAGTRFDPTIRWLTGDSVLWFAVGDGDERRFVRVDRDGTVRRARTAEDLGIRDELRPLPPQPRWQASSRSSRAATVTFENRLRDTIRLSWVDGDGKSRGYGEIAPGRKLTQATFVGHVWIAESARGEVVGAFVTEAGRGLAVFDEASRRLVASTAAEPERGTAQLVVREHDVWWQPPAGEPRRLTDDGTVADAYRRPRHRSPDGRRALGFRVAPGERHLVHLVESAPRDQLQPKLHTLTYRKPGDRIDRPRPVLFDVEDGRRIAVDEAPFADAWRIDRVRWADDGAEVFVLYNRRGHQLLRLYAIDAVTGAVRVVVEERSETFVDYSQKTWLHWLDGGDELLWALERDGWNHLYLVDVATGELRQVTKGEWLVRRVEHVDEARRQIWFTAYGIHP
ncbi:MAG: DPP IV N-terminal domain-containing protein, partial [Planctomycetes bacterium]|nr:DPP IV N-terminal domain-containing protein [Planctomycetota bacterium]